MSTSYHLRRIAVLVSVGKHPVSGTPRYSRNDAAALSLAYGLQAKQPQIAVDVFYAGAHTTEGLTDYLALGVSILNVLESNQSQNTVGILAASLNDYDLILCGTCAEGGEQSGMLPYLLAEALKLPLVGGALDITQSSSALHIQQFLPKGRRRTVGVNQASIVVVHPQAPSTLQYAYQHLRNGSLQVKTVSIAAQAPVAWTLQEVKARPLKLTAPDKRSGHARLSSAIVAESRGGVTIAQGSIEEKAHAILNYLREHQLIDY